MDIEKEITELQEKIRELEQISHFEPYPKKRQQAIEEKGKLYSKLEVLRTQLDKQHEEAERQQHVKRLVENLGDIRISRQSNQIKRFQHGLITLDLLGWEKLNDTKFKVTTEGSKKELEFDLKNLNLQYLKRLFETRYTPIILVVEPEGILTKKGKIRGYWGHPTEYNQTIGDKEIPQTLIALMVV